MEHQTSVKTFGIVRTCKNRYAIATSISDDKTYYHQTTTTYAKPEFAIKKAEEFIKDIHKDFINFQGIAIHFEYNNMGLIN